MEDRAPLAGEAEHLALAGIAQVPRVSVVVAGAGIRAPRDAGVGPVLRTAYVGEITGKAPSQALHLDAIVGGKELAVVVRAERAHQVLDAPGAEIHLGPVVLPLVVVPSVVHHATGAVQIDEPGGARKSIEQVNHVTGFGFGVRPWALIVTI